MGLAIFVLLVVVTIYITLIRDYVLARRKFECIRCGQCCKLKVKLSNKEIEKIKPLGYADFVDSKGYIKKQDASKDCFFLGREGNIPFCKIEKAKPKICRSFPIKKGPFGKKIDHRCKTCFGKIG
jgi:Fe-S-cluster containining protein